MSVFRNKYPTLCHIYESLSWLLQTQLLLGRRVAFSKDSNHGCYARKHVAESILTPRIRPNVPILNRLRIRSGHSAPLLPSSPSGGCQALDGYDKIYLSVWYKWQIIPWTDSFWGVIQHTSQTTTERTCNHLSRIWLMALVNCDLFWQRNIQTCNSSNVLAPAVDCDRHA